MATGREPIKNFVIVGTQRSGTTLLQKLIAENFSVATAFESFFIPIFSKHKTLWGDLTQWKNRTKLLEAIFIYLELRYSLADKLDENTKLNHTLLACRPYKDRIVKNSHSYETLSRELFNTYASIHDKSGFVEKTAYHSWVPLPEIAEIFPNTLFIHLVRNPLDTFASWKNTWFGPRYPETAASIWRRYTMQCGEWGKANSHRYIKIKYEDLISDPESKLQELARKVQREIQFQHNSTAPSALFSSLDSKPWFKNITAAVGKPKISNPKQLTSEEIRTITSIAHQPMVEQGYIEASKNNAVLPKTGNSTSFRFAETLTKNSVKRAIERSSPLVIKCFQSLSQEKALANLSKTD